MADKKNSGDVTTDTTDTEDTQVGKDNSKVFTQDQLDDIVSKRLAKEKGKFQAELQSTVEKERADAERLAKLSAEEKEKELVSKQSEAVRAKEQEIAMRENRLTAVDKFIELKIPRELVDYVVNVDPEKTEANIENFNKAFQDALSKRIAEEIKGNPPKDVKNDKKEIKKPVMTF